MILRATFFNIEEEDNKLYNTYKNERCEVGITDILDDEKITVETLSNIHNNSIVIVDIPDDTISLCNMIKSKHKLVKDDIDTYEISLPFIEKSWILKDMTMDNNLYSYICFDSRISIFDRYFYTRYINGYLSKHSSDIYDNEYIYNLLAHIGNYIAITDVEKKIQQRLCSVICVYLRDYENRGYRRNSEEIGHSDKFYEYFEDTDSDDDIYNKLSSPSYLSEYIKDIVSEYEIKLLNDSIKLIA